MEQTEFIARIRRAVPDAKDLMRAEKIVSDFPNDPIMRTEKAVLQLKKITHVDKMFRRAKAFLDRGISITFDNCKIFGDMTTRQVNDFLSGEVEAVKSAGTFDESEDFTL